MKAFEVHYSTAGKTTSMTVLAEEEVYLDEAVANKDKDFRIGDRYSKINVHREIPLSNVLVSELSVTELLQLLNNKMRGE